MRCNSRFGGVDAAAGDFQSPAYASLPPELHPQRAIRGHEPAATRLENDRAVRPQPGDRPDRQVGIAVAVVVSLRGAAHDPVGDGYIAYI